MSMEKSELKNLLLSASHEIRALRRSNEIMNAQLEMVYLFDRVLHATPRQQQGQAMGEDIAWKIDRALDKIADEEREAQSNG